MDDNPRKRKRPPHRRMRSTMKKRTGAFEKKQAYEKRIGRTSKGDIIDVVPAKKIRDIRAKLELLVSPRAQREFMRLGFEDAFNIVRDVYNQLGYTLGVQREPEYEEYDEYDEYDEDEEY